VRLVSGVLFLLGVMLLGGGLFFGTGALFAWNGRHPVASEAVVPGTRLERSIRVEPGNRYTLAVQVVFEREGLPERDGLLVVEASFPYAASIDGVSGENAVRAVGWLDPSVPPTALFGHGANAVNERRPPGTPPPELVAQRLLGPYVASAAGNARFEIDLGADRIGKARTHEVRAVVYDDAMPRTITVPFAVAGFGGIALILGAVGLFLSLFDGKRRRRNGGGSRAGKNV